MKFHNWHHPKMLTFKLSTLKPFKMIRNTYMSITLVFACFRNVSHCTWVKKKLRKYHSKLQNVWRIGLENKIKYCQKATFLFSHHNAPSAFWIKLKKSFNKALLGERAYIRGSEYILPEILDWRSIAQFRSNQLGCLSGGF